jgi:hypothetical protein
MFTRKFGGLTEEVSNQLGVSLRAVDALIDLARTRGPGWC